ncbi:MAG: hypothetical protein JWN36_1598 [Microbacteriaceae bacterium]|nr:hypothetical protein [Microbacteriaceae bacterium]
MDINADDETLARFTLYSRQLLAACQNDPRVVGLVFMGSGAAHWRVDEWSDHDFAVVCESGAQEALRSDLSWLPQHKSLVTVAREHHDGFKGLYADGHVIEFAVVDRTELGTFFANDFEVALDRGGVRKTMDAVAAKPFPLAAADPTRDFSVFLVALVVGVGRARRGERLSANGTIRAFALEHLLRVFVSLLGTDSRLDGLDVTRRFETAHPDVARELDHALCSELETAGRLLLDIAENYLAGTWAAYPLDAVATVRARLGWR